MSSATLPDRTAIYAADDEKQSLQELQHALDTNAQVRIVVDGRGEMTLPESVHRVLLTVVHDLLFGNAVTIMPIDSELTTNQAANFLNISRPYLIRLLDQGKIPYHLVGSHRRMKIVDLARYRDEREATRREKLSELIALSEDAGLYALEDHSPVTSTSEG